MDEEPNLKFTYGHHHKLFIGGQPHFTIVSTTKNTICHVISLNIKSSEACVSHVF